MDDLAKTLLAWFLCYIFFISTPTFAEKFDPAVEGFMRNQQRQEELQKQIQGDRDVHFEEEHSSKQVVKLTEFREKPCFVINTIRLEGDQADRFHFAIDKAQQELSFTKGVCLRVQEVNLLKPKKLLKANQEFSIDLNGEQVSNHINNSYYDNFNTAIKTKTESNL